MRLTFRWITTLAIFLALHALCRAQSAAPPAAPPVWPVTSAPARFTGEVTNKDNPIPPLLARINLYLPDPKWATMPIRVFNEAGVAVGSDILWSAPGEPLQLIIDSSKCNKYSIYVGSNWPPVHLPDNKAGVWLETREGDGKVINNLPDMLQAWTQSTKVLGRALLPSMFEGGNRFGPQTNLLMHMEGWFELPAATHLDFADSSVDASFVLVDGKMVVQWPGQHERWWGDAGPPQGGVDLAAGIHQVEYYNAYVASPEGNPPVSCTLAVKGGKFPNWTMLQGEKNFFRPIGLYTPNIYELQKDVPGAAGSGAASALAMNWINGEQSVIRTDLADIGFIQMKLNCLQPDKSVLTWTFDDGTTAQGQFITHLFPRPGMRTVHLSWKTGDKEVATLDQTIYVHAEWANPNRQPDFRGDQEADILARDPATLPASDLAGCVAMFQFYLKTDDLLKILPVVCAKINDIGDADLPYLQKAATLLAKEEWDHVPEEIQFLRALVDRCGKGTPSPEMKALGSQARLLLARLIFKSSDHLDEVKALVDAIDVSSLTGDEPRVLNILKADMTLAAGDLPGARKQYIAITGDPSGPDARSSIRRTAKIGRARAFLDRKDFDAAEGALNEVAWNAPIEKLSPDWALTRLRLYQEENLPVPAYVWAKRLMPVLTENGRSELLYRLTDLAFAQKDDDLAQKTLSELLKKHPYSEEAAQAKAKWPGKAQ